MLKEVQLLRYLTVLNSTTYVTLLAAVILRKFGKRSRVPVPHQMMLWYQYLLLIQVFVFIVPRYIYGLTYQNAASDVHS